MGSLEINEQSFLKMSASQQRLILFKNISNQTKMKFHIKVLSVIVGGLTAIIGFIASVVFSK